jgi:hypothetical protein
MSALRVACRSPWGEEHDLVVLRGHVIVPRLLGHDRSLWWLGEEHHPRLAVTLLSVLEQETGAELGLSPYCVPVQRWNKAARDDPWLPVVPTTGTGGSLAREPGVTYVPVSPRLSSLPIPRPEVRAVDLDFGGGRPRLVAGNRLRAGSDAISRLFGALRQLVLAGLLGAALLACVYYLIAATLWLWSVRDGMTGAKIQDGIVLVLVALFFSAVTGLFKERLRTRMSDRVVPPHSCDARERQPVLYTLLNAYRLGITVQLLAFAGFLVW